MMRKSTRRELNKLRELVAYLLRDKKCCFCRKPFTEHNGSTDGEACGPLLRSHGKITIHHRNGDHDDNAWANERLAHQSCHKAFHARLIFATKKKTGATKSDTRNQNRGRRQTR